MPEDNTNNYKPLTITKHLSASREAVWDAWTNPEKLAQWWSPDGFTVPTCELDVRPEGKAHIVMQDASNMQYPMTAVYKEIIKPERLVWINTPEDNTGKALFSIRQTILFKEDGEGTTLEITAEVLSAGPDAAPYLAGMEAGLTQALNKLANVS